MPATRSSRHGGSCSGGCRIVTACRRRRASRHVNRGTARHARGRLSELAHEAEGMDAGQGQRRRQAQWRRCARRAFARGEADGKPSRTSPSLGAPGARQHADGRSRAPRPLSSADRGDPRGARTVRDEPAAAASRHCRARPLRARRRSRWSATAATRSATHAPVLREFRPEQIKQYLAREVIAGLRNASAHRPVAVRRAQCRARTPSGTSSDEERYGELIAELASGMPRARAPVSRRTRRAVVRRLDMRGRPACGRRKIARARRKQHAVAARALAVDIEDAAGVRRIELASVCRDGATRSARAKVATSSSTGSTRAAGTARYGSTKGLVGRRHRVDQRHSGRVGRLIARDTPDSRRQGAAGDRAPSRRVARAGGAHERRAAAIPAVVFASRQPLIEAMPAEPEARRRHPSRPSPRRDGASAWTITARMASGLRAPAISRGARCRFASAARATRRSSSTGRMQKSPAAIARSSPSDESGATVVVHGDNGVTVDGNVHHGPGAEFRWQAGQTLSSVAPKATRRHAR